MDKDHAKTIAISKILDKLQIRPVYAGKSKALYRSPVSKEKQPGFWYYFKTNTWYDYGISAGGDLREFATRFLKFTGEANTPIDVERWIRNMATGAQVDKRISAESEVADAILTVKAVDQIRFMGLVKYLEGIGIPILLARRYAKELKVFNRKTGKTFIAIGIANEDGGYEIRNPFFKGFVQTRGVSFFRGKSPRSQGVHVFNDIFDFLSVLTQLDCQVWEHDTIVLHGNCNIKHAAPYILNYGYRTMYTWMNNDPEGHRATNVLHGFIKNQPGLIHLKMNRVYEEFLSVNRWHVASQMDKDRLKL